MRKKSKITYSGSKPVPGNKNRYLYRSCWALLVALLPLVWLFISSLKKDPLARPGFQLPDSICLDGYISTFPGSSCYEVFWKQYVHCRSFCCDQHPDDLHVRLCGGPYGI